MISPTSDKALWAGMRNGDRSCLQAIYTRHVDALLQYGWRFTRDVTRIEDCIHDLFVDLWQQRQHIGDTDSIRGYLLVALRRRIIRFTQSEIRSHELKGPNPDTEPGIEARIETEELKTERTHQLGRAMDTLTDRQREAIHLKYIEQLSYEDICKIMDISYQSARNLVTHALKKMRAFIEHPPKKISKQ